MARQTSRRKMNRKATIITNFVVLVLFALVVLTGYFFKDKLPEPLQKLYGGSSGQKMEFSTSEAYISAVEEIVGEFKKGTYSNPTNAITINEGKPFFTAEDLKLKPFEFYSELDKLNRPGYGFTKAGKETMPTDDREPSITYNPVGWVQKNYDGSHLYERCHIIAFQLTGENTNKKNLFTGTKALNAGRGLDAQNKNNAMTLYENMMGNYLKKNSDKHVLYRATPIYVEDELVPRGILLEAMSVEDNGEDLMFNVLLFNYQPGIEIDYKTGESKQK